MGGRVRAPVPPPGFAPVPSSWHNHHSAKNATRDHLQIIRSKSETERFHNLKRFIRYRNVSPCKGISVAKIRFTLKLQKKRYKFVTKPFENCSVRKAFHLIIVTDSFQICLTFVIRLNMRVGKYRHGLYCF
jgi:hypothetical protein